MAMKDSPMVLSDDEGNSSPKLNEGNSKEEHIDEDRPPNLYSVSVEQNEDVSAYFEQIKQVGPWYCKQIREQIVKQEGTFEKSQQMTSVEVMKLFENISKQISTAQELMASEELLRVIYNKTEGIKKDFEEWTNNNNFKFDVDNSGVQDLVVKLEDILETWANTTIKRLKKIQSNQRDAAEEKDTEKGSVLEAVRKILVGVATKGEDLFEVLSLLESTNNDIIDKNVCLEKAVKLLDSMDVAAKIVAFPKLEKDINWIQQWFPDLQNVREDVKQSPITLAVRRDHLVSLNGELKFHPTKWSTISPNLNIRELYFKCVANIQSNPDKKKLDYIKDLFGKLPRDARMMFEKSRQMGMDTLAEKLGVEDASDFEINGNKFFQNLRPHEYDRVCNVTKEIYFNEDLFKCVTKIANHMKYTTAHDYFAIAEFCFQYMNEHEGRSRGKASKWLPIVAKKMSEDESSFTPMFNAYITKEKNVSEANDTVSPRFGSKALATYHYMKHSKFPCDGEYTELAVQEYFDKMKTLIDKEKNINDKNVSVQYQLVQEGNKNRVTIKDYSESLICVLVRPSLYVKDEKDVVATFHYNPGLEREEERKDNVPQQKQTNKQTMGSQQKQQNKNKNSKKKKKTILVKVTASPASPPFFLATIASVLQSKGYSVFTEHIHPSNITDKPKDILPPPTKGLSNWREARVKITLVWKEVDGDCEITSESIKGEVNILKYLAKEFDEVFLYERSTNMDSILDTIATLPNEQLTNRETLLRSVTKGLANTDYVAGDDVTIADIALFSYLQKEEMDKDLQGGVKKWMDAMTKWSKTMDVVEGLATNENEIIKSVEKLEVSCAKSSNTYKNIHPVYMSVANSDKIAFVGDKVLNFLLHANPAFRYDLMSGSFVKTGLLCYMNDLVIMGSALGQWMTVIPKDIEWMVLSFGLDDTINQTSMSSTEMLVEVNKSEIVILAEKLVGTIKVISDNFPDTNILYILPPPSESEPCVIDNLRKEFKMAWQRGIFTSIEGSKMNYLDCAGCLTSTNNFEMGTPDSLTFPAAVKVAKEIYCKIFPNSVNKFSDCCSSLHITGTCGKDAHGRIEKEFGSGGGCRLCNSQDHVIRKCPARDHFKEERINCGHCGSLGANLSHHPDNCRDRFSHCQHCNMYGHNEAVHRNPASLKIASDRLGKHGIPFKHVVPTGSDKKPAAAGIADMKEVNGKANDVETSGPA